MSISVGTTNVDSLRAQTNLSRTTQALSKTLERLSSGLRINGASDDPAGLALADKLRADGKIAGVAIRNANDGISLVSIADSALSEVNNVLTRMAELATQSANGIFTNTQRSAMQLEFVALGSEIERIASTTTFNGLNLLSNSSSIAFQVGIDGTSNSQISVQSVLGTLSSFALSQANSPVMTFSIIGTTSVAAQQAAATALIAVNAAIGSLGIFRGILGAAESRLSTAVNALTVQRENFARAESRVRDVDVAEETANLVRLQILQQASTAILAQANQNPRIVLELLG